MFSQFAHIVESLNERSVVLLMGSRQYLWLCSKAGFYGI